MADPDTDATALARWAAAHGLAPSERKLEGETPLLRQGMMDVATDVHEGELDGRPARIFTLYVDAPGLPLLGDTSTTTASFTVLLVAVDAPAWPRVTIHPAEFSGGQLADARPAARRPSRPRREPGVRRALPAPGGPLDAQ